MDSLLANYASSDEEHEEQPSTQAKPSKSESKAGEEKVEDFLPKSTSKRSTVFDSLPQPKSSLFTSLPPPKSQPIPSPKPLSRENERDNQIAKSSKSTSLFSSLPPPKSSSSKRVVQFRPPTMTNPHSVSLDDEDEDADEGEEERKRKRSRELLSTSTPAAFLSSIPAPRHSATLGALPAASGRNRRSVLETEAASSNVSAVNDTGSDTLTNPNVEYSNNQSNDVNYAYSSWGSDGENLAYYSGNGAVPNVDAGVSSNASHLGDQNHEIYDHSSSLGGENYAYYSAYPTDVNSVGTAGSDAAGMDSSYAHEQNAEYTDYGGNTPYESNWANATPIPEVSVENAISVFGRRGRKDIPPEEIVEVNQDELMKNRPREDQVKSTGIAFGPAYQPVSTKGKPTKLHKRKHQIGTLFFEMKQKESELAERRSKGFLTKAQTQGKYGW